VAALQTLLTVLGVVMMSASRRVDRARRQVTRDVLLEIRSADGARQQYRLHAATRRLTLPRRPAEGAECTLIFPTTPEGLRALLSPRAIGRIVEGMNTGGTRIEGIPALLLWFYGLTRIVAPIGSTRRPRRPAPVPIRAPERDAPWAKLGHPRAPGIRAQPPLAPGVGGAREAPADPGCRGERRPTTGAAAVSRAVAAYTRHGRSPPPQMRIGCHTPSVQTYVPAHPLARCTQRPTWLTRPSWKTADPAEFELSALETQPGQFRSEKRPFTIG
jgi:hypothetical protein